MTGLRVLTAVIFGGLLLALLLWAPAWVSAVLVVLVILDAAWEWTGLLRLTAPLTRLAYVLATGGCLALAWWATATPAALQLLLSLAALWWLIAAAWVTWAPHRHASPVGGALAGWITLVPAGVALLRLRLDWPQGLRWLLATLFLVWAADTGAYFAGRWLGRHKLAPQVSPGKTWEGAAGGLLLVAILAAWAAPLLTMPRLPFAALCLLVGCFSIVGDLIESLFKRHAGLKDSGRLLPGHGGMLDRIDSLLAAAPLLMLGASLLGAGT